MSDATGQGTDNGMAPNILPLYELVADELGQGISPAEPVAALCFEASDGRHDP